jgi:hypothetical protein
MRSSPDGVFAPHRSRDGEEENRRYCAGLSEEQRIDGVKAITLG